MSKEWQFSSTAAALVWSFQSWRVMITARCAAKTTWSRTLLRPLRFDPKAVASWLRQQTYSAPPSHVHTA